MKIKLIHSLTTDNKSICKECRSLGRRIGNKITDISTTKNIDKYHLQIIKEVKNNNIELNENLFKNNMSSMFSVLNEKINYNSINLQL